MKSKTIILSNENEKGRGILTLFQENNLLQCRIRLYNIEKLNRFCKIGIYHNKQVYSANLLEKSGVYTSSMVGDFNIDQDFYSAIVDTQNNNNIILSGGTYAGYFFNDQSVFDEEFSPQKENFSPAKFDDHFETETPNTHLFDNLEKADPNTDLYDYPENLGDTLNDTDCHSDRTKVNGANLDSEFKSRASDQVSNANEWSESPNQNSNVMLSSRVVRKRLNPFPYGSETSPNKNSSLRFGDPSTTLRMTAKDKSIPANNRLQERDATSDDCDKCKNCKYKEYFYSTQTLDDYNCNHETSPNQNETGLPKRQTECVAWEKEQPLENEVCEFMNKQLKKESCDARGSFDSAQDDNLSTTCHSDQVSNANAWSESKEIHSTTLRMTSDNHDYNSSHETSTNQSEKTILQALIPQFNYVFDNYPEDAVLNSLLPNGKFVKISENNAEYSIGAIYENDEMKYICYAVMCDYNAPVPTELGAHYQWLPLDKEDPLSEGYYVVFQDTQDLKIVEMD